MSGIKDDEGFVRLYWICTPCAKANGWVSPGNGVTVVMGQCGHCRLPIDQMLTPTCDFRKPGGPQPVWD